MRILIVSHYVAPHLGGIEMVVAQQAASLVARGHQVCVVSTRVPRDAPAHETTDAGYRIVRLPATNVVEDRTGVSFPIPSPASARTVARLVGEHDVVHVHDVFYLTSQWAVAACLRYRKPYYVTQHVALVAHPHPAVMAAQRAVYALGGSAILRRARRVVCYNRTVAAFLRSVGVDETRILLTDNGIDLSRFHPADAERQLELRERHGLDPDRPVVLYVGRMVPKKGYDLVAAIADERWQTVMVGDPGVSRADTSDLRWVGAATPQQVHQWYALADVACLPADGEVFTLVMQEAMACGVPVVAADNPGYQDDPDRAAVRLVERSQAQLHEAVLSLVSDDPERKALARNAREAAVRRFSWEANYDNEYRIYDELQIDDQGGPEVDGSPEVDDSPEVNGSPEVKGSPLVAQVVAFYPPQLGGMERVAQALAEATSEHAEVVVLTTNHGAGGLPRVERRGALTVRRSRTRVVAHTPLSPGLFWRLLRLPRGTIVHVHVAQAVLPESVMLTSLLRRTPYVVHFHMHIDPSGPAGFLLAPYQRLVMGPVLRRAARLVALNHEQAEFLLTRYGVDRDRVLVMANGVSSGVPRPQTPARRRPATPLELLFVGRLDAQKNVNRLLDAMALVREPVRLTIVGEGEQGEQLRARASDEGLRSVHFTGALHGQDLWGAYARADAMVLTSDREGMPLVLLEAMAAGLPIVATDVDGIRSTVGDAGLVVAREPARIAAAIDLLARDSDVFDDLAARSFARGQEFTWPDKVTRLLEIYKGLRSGHVDCAATDLGSAR
ncbi:MAG: glycosyltransferase family 4 protein [Actinomycetales bacterium]